MIRWIAFVFSFAGLIGALYYKSVGDTNSIMLYGIIALYNYMTVMRCENDN
jgi:hypothetical protein